MNNSSQTIKKAEKDEKNEKKQIIPDQLNITIRTSIPGYQKIEYKPSMTIKDISSSGIQFNPLIKLNKAVVDRVPAEYRKKQFFDRGLFQSLLTYNEANPAKGLFQAKRAGYIDNNVKVTLDTIFPVNSVIYIGKQPYAIGDVQWTSGDWKVEVKQKPEEIDISKVTDPQLYSQLVKEEIISGEKQLNELPRELITGNNYSGPPVNVASGVKSVEQKDVPMPVQPNQAPQPPDSQPTQVLQSVPNTKLIQNTQPNQNLQSPKSIKDVDNQVPKQPSKLLALPSSESESGSVEELSPEEERLYESLKGSYEQNSLSMRRFKFYFLTQSYYNIVNGIYLNLPANLKNKITQFYKFVTLPKKEMPGKNLSKSMYTALCQQVKIYNTPKDGDCLFVAVSYGINIYNSENIDKKIYYQNYGKTQLYTPTILREIVLRYYEGLDENSKGRLQIIAETYVNTLNDLFRQSLENYPVATDDEYMERLNTIYISNENFLVYKPNSRPIILDEELEPFKLITEGQVANYIRSKSYWGDQFAMQAICNILKIYIIPIEISKTKNEIKLFSRLNEPDAMKNICSKNIMFLYKEGSHYELITFFYKKQKLEQNNNVLMKLTPIEKKYTIFSDINFPPPFHILVLIYGSNYVIADDNLRDNYGVYPTYMSHINKSVTNIVRNDNNIQSRIFINLFTSKFNLNKPLTFYIQRQNEYLQYMYNDNDKNNLVNQNQIQQQSEQQIVPQNYKHMSPYDDDEDDNPFIIGGAPYNYRPPYNYYPQYNYPSRYNRYITKKPEDRDTSKIAYAITIDMELYPGTSLSPEQLNQSKCNSKYNAIKKAFSEFTGRPYVIPPVYKSTQTKKVTGGKYNRITRKKH